MMMATVRCRVACYLLVLALLCSSYWCSSALAREVYVPVEVACGLSNGKFRWRLPSGSTWSQCGDTGVFSFGTGMDDESRFSFTFCLVAHSLYMGAECSKSCDAASSESTAFTMSVSIEDETEISHKWMKQNEAMGFSAKDGEVHARSGICSLRELLGDKADENRRIPEDTVKTQNPTEATPKKPTPEKPPPPKPERRIQKEIPPAPSVGNRSSTKSTNAPKQREKPTQLAPIATNATTQNKKNMKINADLSENIVWVRTPLRLLLTVLVCTALR
ncbi:mucin-like glycoprotein, putative [Trypanosoma cruzi marinkellei]|uniref:Mucin-like glycoprotein, putative n=1 Tax=Trypanosoma cruzi marinkellei TaxID=85056 RepID=K2M2H7_TRYCR|nr:mucin-like glycoprotein, putative [Trypanosoma cruzi marinkellei]